MVVLFVIHKVLFSGGIRKRANALCQICNRKLQHTLNGILRQFKWESLNKSWKDNTLILFYKGPNTNR